MREGRGEESGEVGGERVLEITAHAMITQGAPTTLFTTMLILATNKLSNRFKTALTVPPVPGWHCEAFLSQPVAPG